MKPGQRILFFGLILLVGSCTPTKYQVYYHSNKSLDVRSGNWLVNAAEGDISYNEKLSLANNLLLGLKDAGIDSLENISEITLDYIVPERLTFELTDEVLKLLKETTDFDFIVNIKAQKLNDDLGALMLTPPDSHSKSTASVSIVVYDINLQRQLFHQQVIATVEMNEGDENIKFSKSASTLIFSALNKGLKDIKKYSFQ